MAGHRDFAPDLAEWHEERGFFGGRTWTWASGHGTLDHPKARITYKIKYLGVDRFEVTFEVREPDRTYRGLLGPDGVVLHKSKFAFRTPHEAAKVAHYHHVRNFHEQPGPGEVWPFVSVGAPHEVAEGVERSEVWPRGQRRWDPNLRRCRADSKYLRVKPDGTKEVLSRGRFVNCTKQAAASARALAGHGKFASGPIQWPQRMVVSPTWQSPQDRAAYEAPTAEVLEAAAPRLIGRIEAPATGSALPANRPRVLPREPQLLPGFLGKQSVGLSKRGGRRDRVKPHAPPRAPTTGPRPPRRGSVGSFTAPDRVSAKRQLEALKLQAAQGNLPISEVNAVIRAMNARWGLKIDPLSPRGRRNEEVWEDLPDADLDAAVESMFTACGVDP